jgi:hypothetical protein
MAGPADYQDISNAIASTGMVARGGFVTSTDDSLFMPDGRAVRTVVVVGNIGGEMWPRFRQHETSVTHPLDAWTRATLRPIADEFGAAFVHPSDEPFQPFQRWAQRGDDVWPSPIGMLIHHEYGLWHAYRGALLFSELVTGLPGVGGAVSPCLACEDRPCLSTCPVDAFGAERYDASACASHVRSGDDPDCLHGGCAARRACPIGVELVYGADQMEFHMRAFVGDPA